MSGGWSVDLLVTNERGDLFANLSKFVTAYDLSVVPLSPKKVLNTAKLINNISPDILLLNNCSLMHYALPLINPGTKPVAVLHSDDERFYKTAAFFGKNIFRWVAPTQGVACRFMSYLQALQRDRVRLIHHGVNNEMYYPPQGAKKITGNVCFVGFLGENKGVELLPDIFHKVVKKFEDARLTVIGDGPLKERLQIMFSQNGMLKNCTFTGRMERETAAGILRNMDILLLPTRLEGFGFSIVEAMMSGVVPVVSRIKGVTDDIVDEGVNGLLVAREDTEGFASAITCLLNNHEKLISMSMAARETAVRRYSAERMINSYESLFAEADDREETNGQWTPGWIIETIREVIDRRIDRKWFVRRVKDLWR